MAIAVYNANTNQVRTFIRDDHGGYVPPEGWTLVADDQLPEGWTREAPDLETARAAKLQTLEAWWTAHEVTGVTPQGVGFALGITASDVALLNGAFTLAQTAVALEKKTLEDVFPIIDKSGGMQSLTLAQMTGVLLAYGEARASLSATYAAYLAAINAAESSQALDAIEIA